MGHWSTAVSAALRWGGLCIVLAAGAGQPCAANSIGVTRTTAAGVPVIVLTVDLGDPRVKVTGVVAQHGCGSQEAFASMVHRTHPTAAVTGTFFGVSSRIPVGDIVINGMLAHHGGVGTGLCITPDNQCEFVQPPHRYAPMDWSRYDFVCCCGPRLVTNGSAAVHPGAEGFHDRHLLNGAARLAVGMTENNKLLFVATRAPIQLGHMAKVMRKLGCMDAINLDAGSSLGVYHGGKMLATPHRQLTNLILIYDDRTRYERFKDRLAPVFAQK
jgi:hypothetical protein